MKPSLLFFLLLLPALGFAQVPPTYEHPVTFTGYTLRGSSDTLKVTGTGAAYSLAGCSVKAEFRSTAGGSAPVVLTFSTASGGGLSIAGAGNNILVWADKTVPQTTPPGLYYADVSVTYPSGVKIPLYRKQVHFFSSYTRLP